MKILTTILALTINLTTFGQIVTLDIHNPAPRVDEEIEISVNLKKKDIKAEYPFPIDELDILRDNNLGNGKIKFTQIASDTGSVTFGPFKFTVDGKEYISDTLTIRVYPKLPPVMQGIWIRQVHFKDKHLLIIEQRMPNDWKKDDKYDMTFNNDGLQFAEIDKETIDHAGFEFNFSYSNSTQQFINDNEDYVGDMVSYQMLIYNIKITDDYNGKFKLKKKHFKNFPKDIDFKEIKIK